MISEIEVGYLSKPEGTIDMGTKWAIKRDSTVQVLYSVSYNVTLFQVKI